MFANVPPLKEYYRSLGDKLRLGFLFIIPNIYSGSINWIQSNYKGVGLATLYQILEEILLWAALSCCASSQPLPLQYPPAPARGTGQVVLWLCRAGQLNLLTAEQCLKCGFYYYIRKDHEMETGHLRRWWVIPPRWGSGTEGLRWHRATFVRNPLAWKAPKPLWTPQE